MEGDEGRPPKKKAKTRQSKGELARVSVSSMAVSDHGRAGEAHYWLACS